MTSNPSKERLQKVIAGAGIASRRETEQMIRAGRVTVNGEKAVLGTKADPRTDLIAIDGKPVRAAEKKVYCLFHKPQNVMVTRKDPQGRPTVYDYLKTIPERINPVGRLDFDSEGLLLLTNDGELALRMTHPRHGTPKTYHAKVEGRITETELKILRRGMDLGDGVTQPCEAEIIKTNPHNTWVELVLKEGKNRQVRRMMEGIGHPVLRLVRVGIGNLKLTGIEKGSWRYLTAEEIQALAGGRLNIQDMDQSRFKD